MKFVRLTVCSFPDLSESWRQFSVSNGDITAGAMAHWEQGQQQHLLIGCELDVTDALDLHGNEIIIPEHVLNRVEEYVEEAVNRIAVLDGSKRRISSPLPSGALVPDNGQERDWLNSTDGIRSSRTALQRFRYRIDQSQQHLFQGRSDGVALLAEAMSHDHPTGRFHELLRLFERAFSLSSTRLAKPLGEFLESSGNGYSVDESTRWVVKIRHPATHADRRDDFVLERGIRPVLRRMEQAAYDVLLNKAEWRTRSTIRREGWKIPCGTSGTGHADIFITQGREMIMESQLIDDFGSYPVFLEARVKEGLPEEFWMKYTRSSRKEANAG